MTSLFYSIYCVLSMTLAHPFFVSISEINHNQKNKSIEITIKLFTSDIEDCLEADGKDQLHLGTKQEIESADKILTNYLQSSFQLTINDKRRIYNYLGKEIENDVTWIYLEIEGVKSLETIHVKNTILIEFEDTQTNLVHIFSNDKKKSLLLNKSQQENSINFK